MNKPLTLLGFDFGTKSIGVAIGQTITKTAKPLTALKACDGEPNWSEIAEIVKDWQPNALVVGVPFRSKDEAVSVMEEALAFADKLEKRFDLPVHRVDERLSTVEAKADLFTKGGYRALNKSDVDAVSAKFILESWMNLS